MKYYSDVTKKFYDNEKACLEAEFKAKEEENRQKILREKAEREEKEKKEKLAAERKARAAEVEETRKEMIAAQNKYKEVLNSFIKDYHTYHYSTSNLDEIPTLFSFINNLF